MGNFDGVALNVANCQIYLTTQKHLKYNPYFGINNILCFCGLLFGNVASVAQLVRAPGCGPGGRGFESRHPPQNYNKVYNAYKLL